MKRHTTIALLSAAAGLLASNAGAQAVDAYGVAQPERGVTGVGINEAAPPEVRRAGGYISPEDLQRRLYEGTVDSAVHIRREAASGPGPDAGLFSAQGLMVVQLDDADVMTRAGMKVGEVDDVLLDAAGNPVAVLVELEDDLFRGERVVMMELGELLAQPAMKDRGVWTGRVDLITDRTLSWFDEAPDWRNAPPPGAIIAP